MKRKRSCSPSNSPKQKKKAQHMQEKDNVVDQLNLDFLAGVELQNTDVCVENTNDRIDHVPNTLQNEITGEFVTKVETAINFAKIQGDPDSIEVKDNELRIFFGRTNARNSTNWAVKTATIGVGPSNLVGKTVELVILVPEILWGSRFYLLCDKPDLFSISYKKEATDLFQGAQQEAKPNETRISYFIHPTKHADQSRDNEQVIFTLTIDKGEMGWYHEWKVNYTRITKNESYAKTKRWLELHSPSYNSAIIFEKEPI